MNRRLPRFALAFAFLAGISACVVNLSFDMDQPNLGLQSPAAGSASRSIQVDLGKYKEIADHKDNIKSLDLDYVDVTVTSVNAGNQARVLNGTIALRRNATDPAANDVKAGDLVNLPVAAGSTVRIKGNPALDAFLLEQLHNGGTFFVVASGTVDGKADLVLDLNLHASLGYDAGML
ncbi:MAG TPA: hypothetical protein VFP52_13480 [Myxococcales bacterium]|nr:hypothetical protein [Myxococcales bacterium]